MQVGCEHFVASAQCSVECECDLVFQSLRYDIVWQVAMQFCWISQVPPHSPMPIGFYNSRNAEPFPVSMVIYGVFCCSPKSSAHPELILRSKSLETVESLSKWMTLRSKAAELTSLEQGWNQYHIFFLALMLARQAWLQISASQLETRLWHVTKSTPEWHVREWWPASANEEEHRGQTLLGQRVANLATIWTRLAPHPVPRRLPLTRSWHVMLK